jgi:hypothetical protein
MTIAGEMTPEVALTIQREAQQAGILPMWVVTTGTKDFGRRFVARAHLVGDKSKIQIGPAGTFFGSRVSARYLIADTLEDLRRLLPPGLVRLDRADQDDRVIVESWF